MDAEPNTTCTLREVDANAALMPQVRVTLKAPQGAEVSVVLRMEPLVLGSGIGADLLVPDRLVSRRHCELMLTARGILVRDLGSKNGTFIQGVRVQEAMLAPGHVAQLGESRFSVSEAGAPTLVRLSSADRFGDVIGKSLPMRALFARLERVAATDETILLLGESGTGKEVLARAVHAASPRSGEPFVVLDCGAIAPTLLEAELFGHARGAFTGAVGAREGLIEEAGAGTLFIDEIGELPLELQPKLLRALDAREVRRVGSGEVRPFRARVIAATHRDLRARSSDGLFREDLYYRLAVVELHVPALRERKEDIPLIVTHFIEKQPLGGRAPALPPEALRLLMGHDWPGNVRELRNVVTRMLLFPDLSEGVFQDLRGAGAGDRGSASPLIPASEGGDAAALMRLSLREVRELALEQIERRYVSQKLIEHRYNISRVAEDIGASRQLVYRMLDRYGLRGGGDDGARDSE